MAKRKRSRDGDLVYSTDHGRMCPTCENPADACTCDRIERSTAPSGTIRVRRETKGRKGKVVTVAEGFALDPFALADLARALKQKCGGGGTAKDDRIEVQGDHVQLVADELKERGWHVRPG